MVNCKTNEPEIMGINLTLEILFIVKGCEIKTKTFGNVPKTEDVLITDFMVMVFSAVGQNCFSNLKNVKQFILFIVEIKINKNTMVYLFLFSFI